MNVQPLFPIPVAFFTLDRKLTKSEQNFVETLEQRPNQYNTTSVDNYILENKKLSKLKIWFQDCINSYVQDILCPLTDVRLRITQSWANYTIPNSAHHKHCHPNSYISGVFYPKADITKDKIFFHKSTGFKQIDYQVKDYNLFNSEAWWFNVGTNMLILFPSSLEHTVEPIPDGELRISIALNTFPVGVLGNEHSLTGLTLKD